MTLRSSTTDLILETVDDTLAEPVHLWLAAEGGLSTQTVTGLVPKVVDNVGTSGYDADPEVSLVFEQSDWSAGAGLDKVRETSGTETRYATATGAITYIKGEVSPWFATETATLDTAMPASKYPRRIRSIQPVNAHAGQTIFSGERIGTEVDKPYLWGFDLGAMWRMNDFYTNLAATSLTNLSAVAPPADRALCDMAQRNGLNYVVQLYTRRTTNPANPVGQYLAVNPVNRIPGSGERDPYVYPFADSPTPAQRLQLLLGGPDTLQQVSTNGIGITVTPATRAVYGLVRPSWVHAVTAENANGDEVLAFTDSISYYQVNPDGGTSDALKISDFPAPVNSMVVMHGRVIIGQSLGMFVYDNSGDGEFVNIEPNIGYVTDRYSVMSVFGDELYATTGKTHLLRIRDPLGDAPQFVDITSRVQFEHWRGMVGDIKGIASWNGYVLIACEGYGIDQTTKWPIEFPYEFEEVPSYAVGNCRLVVYDPSTDTSHVALQFFMDDLHGVAVEASTDTVYCYGYAKAAGSLYPTTVKFATEALLTPFASSGVASGVERVETCWVTTGWMDFGYADIEKTVQAVKADFTARESVERADGTMTDAGSVHFEYRTEEDADLPDGTANSWHMLGGIGAGSRSRTVKPVADIRFDKIRFRISLIGMTKLQQVVFRCRLSDTGANERRAYELRLETSGLPESQQADVLRKLEKMRKLDKPMHLTPQSARMSWLDADIVRFRAPGLSVGTMQVHEPLRGPSERSTGAVVHLISDR